MSGPERIADALVLVFTAGVSLRDWADTGLLEREWALYERLGPSFGRVVLVTYGDGADAAILRDLAPEGEVVSNTASLGEAEYVGTLPDRVAAALAPAVSVIVKTNQMQGGDAALAIVARLRELGKRAALVARGGYPWSRFVAREHGPASPQAALAAAEEGRLCKGADGVIGTTRAMVDDLAWRHAIPAERFTVVPNYVADDVPKEAPRRERGVVLFAGRLEPQKRVDRLIDAMALLPEDLRRTTTLSIIGAGSLAEALRAQVQRRGVLAAFEPRLPHGRLLDRMRRCTVYAQTSDYEGHPKTVLEAMATGAPVVVCDTPGLGEVVEHGRTGLRVGAKAESVAEGLGRLLLYTGHADTLGANAAAHVRSTLGLGHIVELELDVHRRAMAASGAPVGSGPGLDLATAVRWDPGLLGAGDVRAVDSWTRSLRGFARRLGVRERARFLMALDTPLYHLQGEAAVEADHGLHPKHRLMGYHDFFVDRIKAGQRVIDLGSGVGALAASIAGRSRASVVGMDWSATNVERARRIGAERGLADRLDFVLGDITRDRAPGRFDCVVLSNVLEHLTARPERLGQWREWYRPDRFLIRVPAFDREWRVPWKKELGVEWRLDPTHETEYTQGQLEEELRRASLKIVELVAHWGEFWTIAAPA